MICPECRGKGTAIYYCEIPIDENNVVVKKYEDICHTCHGSGQKPQTNADRIRAMSDEELADLLDDFGACSRCRRRGNDCFPVPNTLGWLRQPVKDGDNDG